MIEKEKQRIIELRNNGLGYGAIVIELGISKNIVKPDVIDAWDDNLWILLIKKAIVHHDKSITFVFNNLSGITIAAE